MTDAPALSASKLRTTAYAFANAFLRAQLSPQQLLDTYLTADCAIIEHGPVWMIPRLPAGGKPFMGRNVNADGSGSSCDDYFKLLGGTLRLHVGESGIPDPDGFVVDPHATQKTSHQILATNAPSWMPGTRTLKGVAFVKCDAEIEAQKTGKRWEEEFVLAMSGFQDDGKFALLEIWADDLSAWVAVGEAEEQNK